MSSTTRSFWGQVSLELLARVAIKKQMICFCVRLNAVEEVIFCSRTLGCILNAASRKLEALISTSSAWSKQVLILSMGCTMVDLETTPTNWLVLNARFLQRGGSRMSNLEL